MKWLPNCKPGRELLPLAVGSSTCMPAVLAISQSVTSTTSLAGTVNPAAWARRVASSSLASTRRCCGLFWNLTTHSVAVGAEHQLALRSAPHPPNRLYREHRQGDPPILQRIRYVQLA